MNKINHIVTIQRNNTSAVKIWILLIKSAYNWAARAANWSIGWAKNYVLLMSLNTASITTILRGGGSDSSPSCFSSTILKRLKLWSWNFLRLKIHLWDTFYQLYYFVIFRGVTIATKLQKVPCKISLKNRKVKFLNNSVIFKDIELKFGMASNFGSLNYKK